MRWTALVMLLPLCGCPAFGTPDIPCQQSGQCPTGYTCSAGTCAEGGDAGSASGPGAVTVTGVAPAKLTSQTAASLVITGTGFDAQTTVALDGAGLSLSEVGSTRLVAQVSADAAGAARQATLRVQGPAGSATAPLEVDNPVPVLSEVAPTDVVRNSPDQTVALTGSDFRPDSVAYLDATALATTYQGPTALTAVVPAALLRSTGTLQLTVRAPAPGGGTSAAQPFTVSH